MIERGNLCNGKFDQMPSGSWYKQYDFVYPNVHIYCNRDVRFIKHDLPEMRIIFNILHTF